MRRPLPRPNCIYMNENFKSGRGDTTRQCFSLTTRQHDLLVEILALETACGGPIPALKFRAEHRGDRGELDKLQNLLLLNLSNDQYRVSGLAVPFLDSVLAKQLMNRLETVFFMLRGHYETKQAMALRISEIAIASNLSIDETADAIRSLRDGSLWFGGCSNDLRLEGAIVACRENILDFDSFKMLAEEVLSWAPPPPEALSADVVPGPSNINPLFSTNERTNARSDDFEFGAIKASRKPVDFVHAWQAARSSLLSFTFDQIKDIAGLAGLNLPAVAHLSSGSGSATKGHLMTAFDGQVADLGSKELARMVTTIFEELLRRNDDLREKMSEDLNRLGWSFSNGALVPIELFDIEDLAYLSPVAHSDLLKAAKRMREGDLSGAIGAACGAVDSATSRVYEELQLGDPAAASFQERCKKAVQAKGVLAVLDDELTAAGWQTKDILPFKKNLEGALNQAAYVLQSLRSEMGDAHGTKPIVRFLAFESLKWSELIVAALSEPRRIW